MKITSIDCHVLLDPEFDIGATSSAQDDLVVEIHTDEGLTGVGETDVNPWIARACIEAPGTHSMGRGLTEMLLGQDPLDPVGLWQTLYTGSAMNGRRGALIHSMGALDIALHDLRGKARGLPCYALLSDEPPLPVWPYASLQPDTGSFTVFEESLIQWTELSKSMGFKAAKVEITPFGPYAHKGMKASAADMTALLRRVRSAVGDDFTLMLDVQYAFPDADTCLAVIRGWEDLNLFFIETPLPSDDLDGYARLAREQKTPIAAGEWLATRFEFLELMDRGLVQVVQPDIGRVGGLTEAWRVCRMAQERGRTVVPHLWKTGLSIAAAAHLAAVTPNCAFIEYLPKQLCESALRRKLLKTEPSMVDGQIVLTNLPGFGVELDRDALEHFTEAAERKMRDHTAFAREYVHGQ
jgi:L-alanine-DL-glutamate epimerase-like enolase superfamily enzyme